MDYIQKYKSRVFIKIFLYMLVGNVLVVGVGYAGLVHLRLDDAYLYGVMLSIAIAYGLVASQLLSRSVSSPLDSISQAISYARNNTRQGTQPAKDTIKIARELVHSLSMEVYSLASATPSGEPQASLAAAGIVSSPTQGNQFIDLLAVPIVGLDHDQRITRVNRAACDYIGVVADKMIGQPIYDVFKLSFQSDENLDAWIQKSKSSTVTAVRSWDRVRHSVEEDTVKQFDLVARFSANSDTGTETTLALYDRTNRYSQDDQEISFVALAVHELRTPLTIMRGYIEIFEDELGPNLDPEMADFMHKMHASAQQLAAFVSNILNVARVEENQLALRLRSESWPVILQAAVSELELRASVHGKHIELIIAENIPPIAGDRVSLHEIINNLVDNAIKYGGTSNRIIISCVVNSEGGIETSVQDFGIGIPQSVVGDLFQKFHRSHKSKVQVGGTGLGLYLCKALVQAHGGNIWVRSKEDEGSIFTFTLLPFDQLSAEEVSGEDGIIREAHGWIKNHSLYRG
jgi:signal transduction histidine kinase